MRGCAGGPEADPQRLLFRDRDAINQLALPEDVSRAEAAFIEHELGVDVGRMVGEHPPHALVAACLFIAAGEHNDVPLRREADFLERDHGHQVHDPDALHVECAPAPDKAVLHLARKRIHAPPGFPVHRHDIEMVQQQQRFFGFVSSGDARDKVDELAIAGVIELDGDAYGFEFPFHELGGGLGVGRRVDARDLDIALQ